MKLMVEPGVFHPGFFFSSKVMLHFLDTLSLKGLKVLEIGSGSGILSLYCAKMGAEVTACDISCTACENTKANQLKNGLRFNVLHSDLFSSLPAQRFDLILVNPPYYKKTPRNDSEHAWYCGEEGEYFERFFRDLNTFIHKSSQVYMVLFDGIDLQMIERHAKKNRFAFTSVYSENNWIERNFILRIESSPAGNV
ncbi:MAG: methyltransferase [Bacteroidia bacterium]|nr:methyltransferase [Bacteroidia bacterium]